MLALYTLIHKALRNEDGLFLYSAEEMLKMDNDISIIARRVYGMFPVEFALFNYWLAQNEETAGEYLFAMVNNEPYKHMTIEYEPLFEKLVHEVLEYNEGD